jgi:hypothetical protein
MITRVRHNRCVIRVNPGRVRMHANAIMFARPALKVYPKLPPSRDEISEVLAFIFTGSVAPTQEDFNRTPILVRRHRVAEALEWPSPLIMAIVAKRTILPSFVPAQAPYGSCTMIRLIRQSTFAILRIYLCKAYLFLTPSCDG